MDNDIKIINFDKNANPVDKVSEMVIECFDKLKGMDLLVMDRKFNGNYLSVFAESLYTYEKGVVLLERFFKKDKCKQIGQEYKTFSDEDRKVLSEFNEFAHNIPSSVTTTEKEREEYYSKLSDFEKEIENIKPQSNVLDVYKYDNSNLILFDNFEDKDLKNMSDSYSSFGISILTTLTWGGIDGVAFGITTIDNDDYVDLIMIPIK